MIYFDSSWVNLDKTPDENIRILKSYLDEQTQLLNMLSEEVESLKKKKESEGK